MMLRGAAPRPERITVIRSLDACERMTEWPSSCCAPSPSISGALRPLVSISRL